MYKNTTAALKQEMTDHHSQVVSSLYNARDVLMGMGYCAHREEAFPVARAYAFAYLLDHIDPFVYDNDWILGSVRAQYLPVIPQEEAQYYTQITNQIGRRGWLQNCDHYASAYDRLLSMGVDGILEEIRTSQKHWEGDEGKQTFLQACTISMEAFSRMIERFGQNAKSSVVTDVCRHIAHKPPESFHQALQLVWFAHCAYLYQGLYAMALGRIDQYLYPFYKKDIDTGVITRADAQTLLENTFMKMHDYRTWYGADDVCNICIGGITPDGKNATTDLTFDVLYAVGACNIPGPNLSARIHPTTPDAFLIEALKVIGTGLGYPALMNDIPNITALRHMGYAEADANNYCMVGCIENFLPGMQPPWSDGRFDNVKYLELALNRGMDMRTGQKLGLDVGDPASFTTMDEFVHAYERELADAAAMYVWYTKTEHGRYNNANYVNPFMSCLTYHCIEQGLDICNGGARYPSAHGAALMGIGTIADSLAAIEKVIYQDHAADMTTLVAALKANFVGYEELRQKLLDAPKYGNDDDFVDKWAVWFVQYNSDLFDSYRLDDGGRYYTAIASNTSNIYAGQGCAASPDGRLAGEPCSDAASPTYGRDHRGPTCTVKSCSKPDYGRVACGTVLNQKYSPAMFRGEENLRRLCALIRVYFQRGGQEMQINSVSREVLLDAMEHPENYQNLVVRVSGFSAYYVTLPKEVQADILHRTVQY